MKVKTQAQLTMVHISKKISHFVMTPFVIFIRNFMHFSIHSAPSCRFDPTCLSYSKQAFSEFGIFRGVYLTLKRVINCHPFSRKGLWDPIPRRDSRGR